jgi:hypothetical protein
MSGVPVLLLPVDCFCLDGFFSALDSIGLKKAQDVSSIKKPFII